MMAYYFVKEDLFGVPRGRVERFLLERAAPLLAEGKIALYDEKAHGDKPGAEAVPENLRQHSGKCPRCGK